MSNAIKVGIFMFVVLVITGVFIIKIEDIPTGKGGAMRVTVVFPDVAGLDEKSAVRVAGVRVGKVESIRLLDDHAEVVLLVDGHLTLSKGASAAVRNMGFLGDKFVELIPGNPSLGRIPEDTKLKGYSPVSYDRILALVTSIGEDVKVLTESFRQTLGDEDGSQRLDRIVQNIEDFTFQVKEMVAENRKQINASTSNIEHTTADIRDKLPAILDGMNNLVEQLNLLIASNRSNIDETMVEVKGASVKLNASLTSMQGILEGLERGEGTAGKILKDDQTHESLIAALDSVKGGADSLNETIGRVKNWDLDMDFRGEYLTELEETKTYFGLKLTTNARHFYMLEVVDDPLGKRKEKVVTETTTHDDGSVTTETTQQIKYDDTYMVSAMFGWKFDRFQLRGGLLEGSGGAALDYLPWENRMRLTVEAFDFSRDDVEADFHLKLSGKYYLNSNLYFIAGWDDMLSEERESVFFGGGLTWSDEDFKYLIGGMGL